ncbi:SDR family oxidoreductase [Pleomorphovibrio marinus]|uniref:SDR family oxidoreductase n=1 Tax=Pleomorphovibrio marinus TaxID=2164132 RepID=UPI000E0C1B85|nr:SDR family oxidoreductase [Pleomorphovibrio marinus]
MELDYKDKVALVTGAAFGIGKATAIAFAKKGAKVVVVDWVEAKETLEAIEKEGGEALFLKCDMSKEEDIKMMVDKTIEKYGKLDVAFNNAGIEGLTGITHECTNDNWHKVISVNLTGVWHCMKHQIAQMLKQGKGAIVNNASIAGLVGFPGVPAYVASKHAVIGLTKNAALEYGKLGIRVNVVCPGVIKTPMIDRFTGEDKEVEKQFVSMKPIGRLGEPEEVAEAVLWLCSEGSSFVTGHSLTVDGGWVAQ